MVQRCVLGEEFVSYMCASIPEGSVVVEIKESFGAGLYYSELHGLGITSYL